MCFLPLRSLQLRSIFLPEPPRAALPGPATSPPSCAAWSSRCSASIGRSSSFTSSNPASVSWCVTTRRSSRRGPAVTSPRCSSRSISRVMSGSRATSRCADVLARRSVLPRPAQNAQHVVLRRRQQVRLQNVRSAPASARRPSARCSAPPLLPEAESPSSGESPAVVFRPQLNNSRLQRLSSSTNIRVGQAGSLRRDGIPPVFHPPVSNSTSTSTRSSAASSPPDPPASDPAPRSSAPPSPPPPRAAPWASPALRCPPL